MPLNADAVAGVSAPVLQQLLHDHWEFVLRQEPVGATRLGDHRYDALLGDPSPAATERSITTTALLLERAAAIDAAGLSADDRITLELFQEGLAGGLAVEQQCRFAEWNLSTYDNALTYANDLARLHPVETVEDGLNLLARYRALPTWFAGHEASLRQGARQGRYASRTSVERLLTMTEDLLATPVETWALMEPLKAEHPTWSAAETRRFRKELEQLVTATIRPTFVAYADFLRAELLPYARSPQQPGLRWIAGADACYAATIRYHTGLDLTPAALHQTGLDELARIHAAFQALGEKLFGTSALPAIFARLRTDPALYFTTEDEVAAKAQSALDAARAAIPQWFGRLPQTDCVVSRVPAYLAPHTTIAWYQPPIPGESSGEYYINTYAPTTRPRHEAEVLAFHESIPGHHLQIALSQEMGEMPAFRRHFGSTAYVEGWALYTERLAEEMGLYSGDIDRMGVLSFDAWRASRLVVDTGLHSLGWSREQAIQFMMDNTPLAPNNIENEVDRYIGWPGQALAYKTGQLEILRMRAEAEARLGSRFSIQRFHDLILSRGAVTLPVLQRMVDGWVAQEAARE